MASQQSESTPYLKRPLYVYDLPPELLSTLKLRSTGNAVPEIKNATVGEDVTVKSSDLGEDGISKSTSCALCRATFRNVDEQRQHVRSDFHRYNIKLSVKNIPPVDESTFIKQIGDLDESISGSDSSTTESEDDNSSTQPGDSTLAALLRKQAKLSNPNDDDSMRSRTKNTIGGAPILWLSSPKTGENIGLGMYRAILSVSELEQASSHLIELLQAKQVKPVWSKHSGNGQTQDMGSDSHNPHFFLCMIGGGHFAAAIIGLAPEMRKGAGGIEERHAVVKAHKTFHRYTTRRKQGGSQSANDNAKGNAHSAGSSIRRYNEIALETDVRNVLSEWKSMIDSADLIFIRASGTTSRRTLFGPYDGQVLTKTDQRIRGFPFSTRRATQGELLRAFQELTRLKISTFVEVSEEMKHRDPKPKAQKQKPVAVQRSQEEESALLHTSQLQNLIRRTKAPGMLLYLKNNELDANFEFFPQNEHHHAPRPLHLSASINSPSLVTALLTKANANPCLKNADGKTAYDIAGDARTRDAFRVARNQLGENAWDWSAAHVASGISSDEAEARSKREQDQAKTAEADRRQADLEKIRQQEEQRKVTQIERKAGTGKALGAAVEKTGAEKREEEMRGLTPEMRQRLERERRARAAEARLKAMSGK